MGFWEQIGVALILAIREEEKEEKRRREMLLKLDNAESDFSDFCTIWGFSQILYIADYSCLDLGKEFVDDEIRKMEEYKEKLRRYVTLGGDPALLDDLDSLDDYIEKVRYLDSVGILDDQKDYLNWDYDDMVSTIEEEQELQDKIGVFEMLGGDADLIIDMDEIDDYLEKITYLRVNNLLHRQDEFLEYDFEDMIEAITEEYSDSSWDDEDMEDEDLDDWECCDEDDCED